MEYALGAEWRESILSLVGCAPAGGEGGGEVATYVLEDAYFFREAALASATAAASEAALAASLADFFANVCPRCASFTEAGRAGAGQGGAVALEGLWAEQRPCLCPGALLPRLMGCTQRAYGSRTPLHLLLQDEGRDVCLALPLGSREGALLSMSGVEAREGWGGFDTGYMIVW